ncbi:hypothetical protein KEM48_006494 [Puccinia striiformis f. sp. tritici PST-130]|nr:hypothetical protein KEM48_006494 [Puccinia striiformis f. sp. tritici PST-130]
MWRRQPYPRRNCPDPDFVKFGSSLMRLRRRSIGGLVETATTLDQARWHPTTRKGQSWQDFQDFATGSCGYAGTHYGASQRLTVPTVPSSPQAVRQRLLRLGLPGQSSYAPPEENDRHAVVSARPKVVDSDTESSLIHIFLFNRQSSPPANYSYRIHHTFAYEQDRAPNSMPQNPSKSSPYNSLRLNMSWAQNSRRFFRGRWHGIVIVALLTIGFTAQNPLGLVARNQAVAATSKPPMGWSSDWAFDGCILLRDDDFILAADQLDHSGLKESGYRTLVYECGWEVGSESDGTPKVDLFNFYSSSVFPNGPQEHAGWLKSRGFNLGLGSWLGNQLCPRTDQFWTVPTVEDPKDLQQYMKTIVGWGISYLIHRPCDMATPEILQDPARAQEAIRAAGVQDKLFYATGLWGSSPLAQQKSANSWRISDENLPQWDSFIRTMNGLVPFAHQTRPGAYNDLGFLRFSARNREAGLTLDERTTIWTFFAAAKSPLMISDDLVAIGPETTEMMKNRGVIAINQDELGKSIIFRRRYPNDMDIWSGPLKDGSTVADTTGQKLIQLADMGFESARIHDVRTGNDLGSMTKTFSQNIPGHGSAILRLSETKEIPKRNFVRFAAEKAEVVSPAYFRQVGDIKVAAGIEPEGKGSVVWKDVPGRKQGPVLVSFDYINADLPWGNRDHSKLNFKRAAIMINDDPNLKFQVHFPSTGYTWSDGYQGFLVSLPLPNEKNTIRIVGLDHSAPDFAALSVEVPATPAMTTPKP